MYTEPEQRELSQILRVFKNYIRKTPQMSIIPVASFGYVFTASESDSPVIITDPAHLCFLLFKSIAADILAEHHSRTPNPSKASKAAKSAIRKRLNPYLRQLPAYRPLLSDLLEQ